MADVKKINGYNINDDTSRNNIGCTADTYDNSKTYKIDDVVVYNKMIYKCITAVTAAEKFNSKKWQQICLRDLTIETKQSLKALENECERLENEYVQKTSKIEEENILLKSQIPTGTAEGESITLSDSSNLSYKKFNIRGKSIQDGTPTPETPIEIQSVGDDVNLFNIEEFEANIINKKIINDSGVEVTDSTSSYSTYKIPVKANQDCYIKGALQRIYFYDVNGNFVNRSSNSTGINTKYTPTQDGFIGFQINISYWSANKGQEKIHKGTVATPYSEYGKGTVEIKQSGKNLLNVSNEFIVTKVIWDISIDMPIGTYTLSVDEIVTDGTEDKFLFLFYYDDGKTLSKFLSSTNKSLTFNIEKQIVEVNIFSQSSNASSTDVITTYKNIMISKQGGEYEEYKENSYVIPTTPLRSLQNGVCDTKEKDGTHRRVGSVILDGSEGINYSGFEGLFWIGINNLGIRYKSEYGLSNYFKNILSTYIISNSSANNHLNDGEFSFRTGETKDRIYFKHLASGTDVNNFKTWLSENPIQVDYELEEEVIEPFDEEQQEIYDSLINNGTFKGVTNINSSSEIAPEFDIEYYKDLEIILNQLANRITALEGV